MADTRELRAGPSWFSTLTNEELVNLVRAGLGNERQSPNAHAALWHLADRIRTVS